MQAYLDGELGQSERVIFDRHVGDCPACTALFRRHQRASALMFEAYAEERLTRDLTSAVLENLPELEPGDTDMEGINWRAKHPASWSKRVARFVPAAALLVLTVLAFVIVEIWPATRPAPGAIGMVTHVAGSPLRQSQADANGRACVLQGYVTKGERFETDAKSTLMLSMVGPTQIKLNQNSKLRVEGDRRLTLEDGEVWLDVGGKGNPFKVFTPNGDVVVFGTAFDVRVTGPQTTVTVKRGHVTLENRVSVRSIAPGEQAVVTAHGEVSAPRRVDVGAVTRWADQITSEERAATAFENFLFTRSSSTELTAKAVFIFNTQRADGTSATVKSITLFWEPDGNYAHHCGYTVYVFDDAMRVLFRERIDGSVFDNQVQRSEEIIAPGKPITGVKRLSVRLVPDYRSGDIETTFEKVTATVS